MSDKESVQQLNAQVTATPVEPDVTLVDLDEYSIRQKCQKGYLERRSGDRSATILTVTETVRHDNTTMPDPSPEIFSDGFESGHTSAWRDSSPTGGGFATTP